MTDQATETQTADPAAALRKLADGLRQQYPRAAHRGRLDQVEQLLSSAAGLVAELPAEEEREAELEARLLKHYDEGNWKSTHPDHGVTHTAGAAERLADALQRRKAG